MHSESLFVAYGAAWLHRWSGMMNLFSFFLHHMDGWVCVLTWGTRSTRIHYGKKAMLGMQCDALAIVLCWVLPCMWMIL